MRQSDRPAPNDDAEQIDDLKAADAKEVHRAVREAGEVEVNRPAASLLWSGLAAGFAINASLLAEAALHAGVGEVPWRTLVVSLGYPIGFVIVILGRMQFFTESTITAMLPLVTRPSLWTLRRTLRLWALVILANLAGTALTTLALTHLPMLDPSLRDAMASVSAAILRHDAASTFWTAIPAGFMIASIAWMLPNAREQSFLVIFAVTYAVGVTGLSHSVVGSAEAFTLMWTGRIGAAQALFVQIAPAVIGNLVGGAGLFAVLAHGQVRPEMHGEGADE
ncbi:formate/nitrite transporter family protein [Sphingomonas sp. RHCKR47]|uniref:formate/nitrite transporter family protein n=1 Tax=Sphingomonas citricola TaxID=2862498 RepID=UPI001C67368C|nr:formate/nitrite transporter family protein [Sphingomonas citricola]MBW6522581.1 formate/nitrite transporter family protein [Sphingomonas citricola]